ncbi:aminotransferase class I/II-fold pyridoxal phosphate-dependent enzyme [Streptococcus equinus]|uniref:aminotransferase class I/II-fold pyridoxal phosphate-dependent enzyme n=1 Tax=Streptococcus equinus TaxID=1335 RepID=UPI0005F797CF|nr:aminotransferase class I/II-fold pyridoxal phosphate-dependent enzyme [Streptococcus equinus]
MEKLLQLISDISGEDIASLDETDELIDDIGFDSLMIMDLVVSIKNTFDLKGDIKLSNFNPKSTIADVWTLIRIQQGEISEVCQYSKDVTNIENFPELEEFNAYYNLQKDKQPYFRVDEGIPTNHIKIDGRSYINYSTYNYLGLNGNEEVKAAAKSAIDKYGTSVSGSRLLSGEISLHGKLEKEIADFLGTDDAIVQVGGHSTNVNMIGNIVGEGDLILHDELAHNSIVQGAILSHSMRRSFKHNDMKALEKILTRLRNNYRRALIVVEGVYSMDGDTCHLPELIELKNKYGCILMIDEAHSFGTIGEHGSGICDYYHVDPSNVDILMGTLSKSGASCGGYIAGSKKFINWLKFNSPGFIFSAGITPPNTASALKAIQIFKKDSSVVKKLQDNSKYLLEGIKKLGFNTGLSKDTPVIPIIIGESERAMKLSNELYKNGINALPIIYPAVKESEARIRFFLSSLHTKEDLDNTISILSKYVDWA